MPFNMPFFIFKQTHSAVVATLWHVIITCHNVATTALCVCLKIKNGKLLSFFQKNGKFPTIYWHVPMEVEEGGGGGPGEFVGVS